MRNLMRVWRSYYSPFSLNSILDWYEFKKLTAMNMRNQNSNDKCLIKNDYHNARKNNGYNNSSNLDNPIYYSIININSSFMFINNQSDDLELITNDAKILDDEILNNEIKIKIIRRTDTKIETKTETKIESEFVIINTKIHFIFIVVINGNNINNSNNTGNIVINSNDDDDDNESEAYGYHLPDTQKRTKNQEPRTKKKKQTIFPKCYAEPLTSTFIMTIALDIRNFDKAK
ncbi:hypothetical protein H8356DRAFT_1326255 [Neocallimastix lanati (nom. inval.)]|nr:hypothetical protein H8356DRAFT_1326255 [Neocallimastix sp. JGI-2020a]